MCAKPLFMRRRWKPPYIKCSTILFLVLIINAVVAQNTNNEDQPQTTSKEIIDQDSFQIFVEASSHGLNFSISDTENYELQSVSCKVIKSGASLTPQELSCDNLDACSSYLATLSIKNLKDETQPIIERNVEASTEYEEPTTEIFDLTSEVESIHMSWNATDRTCISEFLVEVKSSEKEFKYTLTNDKNELLIDSLNPCQDYNIQLKTFDVNNNTLISNLTTTQTTLYGEPGNVTVNFENNQNGQIKAMWEQPKYRTCISFYLLKWYLVDCPKSRVPPTTNAKLKRHHNIKTRANSKTALLPNKEVCEWTATITDSNAKEFVITQLEGCEMYYFEVYINNDEVAKSEVEGFHSAEQVPGIVTLQTPATEPTRIKLRWNAPNVNRKCVNYYQVNITGPQQRADELQQHYETTIADAQIIFEDLDPCGHYNYTIAAISLSGWVGEAMNSTFETTEATPSPVQNYIVTPEPHALNITWDPPAFSDLCLNGYRFSGWTDDNISVPAFNKITNDTRARFEYLYSCQSYTIQIIPTTVTMDGVAIQIDTETAANVSLAPETVRVTGVYPGGLELSAQENDVNNKCEIIYARFSCELSKSVDVPYKSVVQYVEGQVGGISFKSYLSPLSPFTEYKCSVAFYNVAGWSLNRTIIQKTEAYFPTVPESVTLKKFTNTTITYSWLPPKYTNGNIKLYTSHFQRVQAAYYIPPKCPAIKTEPFTRETSSMEQVFNELQPYTQYSIQVAATNEYGVGQYTGPFIVHTSASVSEPVSNLLIKAEGPDPNALDYRSFVVISWTAPCKSNGFIEHFELKFAGERSRHDDEEFHRFVTPVFDAEGRITHNETYLRPEFNYSVSVSVKIKDVAEPSAEVLGEFEAPAGIPRQVDEAALDQARVNAFEASNPTSSAVVRFPASLMESDAGTILYMALLISEKGCNPKPQLHYGVLNVNMEWPNSLSWNEVYENSSADCIVQYQTTPLRWKPTPVGGAAKEPEYVEYIIGVEKCQDTTKRYCNGPLKPDRDYYMVIRLFTKSGYNDATVLAFRTDSLIQLATILISVASCLLVALIAGFIYLWVTKRILWHSDAYYGIEDSFGDIVSKNYAVFYADISKPEKIAREYKELTLVAMDLSYSASELGCNKNRYADIYPYDKNRVILDIDSDGSDYINASFIDGYRRKKEYIATQGPKPESSMDFWRMVLQHNVRVIVMVTQFREGDVVKCHEYYPFKSKGINVVVKKKENFEVYDRSEMTVTHEKYSLKQKVVHYYFKKWPDHGCPSDPTHLISFIRKVKSERVPSYSPVVVHCSAGVGRTGTLIGLDIIMQRLRTESKVNIYETVKKLRFQRMKMVQTLAQYTFLYSCTYELVRHKNTRAVQKQQLKGPKKVSFQDEAECINDTGVKRFKKRRSGTDLRSIEEQEYADRNGNTQLDTVGGSDALPVLMNGQTRKRTAPDLVEEQVDNDRNCARNNESSM